MKRPPSLLVISPYCVKRRPTPLKFANVYPAGETPIPGADGRSLARAVRLMGHTDLIFVDRAADMDEAIMTMARDGDVVVTMGAGNVGLVAPRMKAANQ